MVTCPLHRARGRVRVPHGLSRISRAVRLVAVAVVLFPLLRPASVVAQPSTTLEVGDRVRLTLGSDPAEELVGQLTRIESESISVWLDVPHHRRRNLKVPRAAIFRLERATQVEVDKSGVAKGILAPVLVVGVTSVTAILGMAVGGGVESMFKGDPCRDAEWLCIPTGVVVGFFAGVVAGVGISIWMLNQPDTEERWLPARLPGDALGRAMDRPDAPWGVALTVRF